MDTFKKIEQIFTNLLNGNYWIKRKNISINNLNTCNGEAFDDDNTNTCKLCVALNDIIFKKSNMPEFAHKNCKCYIVPISKVNFTVELNKEKITKYLFVDVNKKAMMNSMGYTINDWKLIYNLICDKVKINFTNNNYTFKTLNIYGQHFQVNYILQGQNKHKYKSFYCHTGCVAYPNGKIRIATPLIKD